MAAPAVASFVAEGNTASLFEDATKPTGLAEGDLMVAMCMAKRGSGANAFTTPSGWTAAKTAANGSSSGAIFYKTASSADAAASTFRFEYSGGGGVSGIVVLLMRITHSGYYFLGADITNNDTNLSSSIVAPAVDTLVIVAGGQQTAAGTGWDGYAINGTNPSWTEITDNPAGTGLYFGAARADIADITARTISTCDALEGGANDEYRFIFVVTNVQSATGTAALLTNSGAFFASTSSAGTTGTAALLQGTPTVNNATGTVDNFRWTNETGTDTTWTNES